MTDFTSRIEKLNPAQREQLALRLQGVTKAGRRQQLSAFYVTQSEIEAESLHDHLARHLPEYMLPHHYIPLPYLPRTANGKIDRHKLVTPEHEKQSVEMSELESALARIWAEVLDMDNIQANDDYFELGGDSITSIQIVARAATCDIHFSPADLLEHPSVRQLARGLSASNPTDSRQTNTNESLADTTGEQDLDEMLRIMNLDQHGD